MLYRFYDPYSGRVLINGQDIKKVELDSLRKVIGIVPQVKDHSLSDANVFKTYKCKCFLIQLYKQQNNDVYQYYTLVTSH